MRALILIGSLATLGLAACASVPPAASVPSAGGVPPDAPAATRARPAVIAPESLPPSESVQSPSTTQAPSAAPAAAAPKSKPQVQPAAPAKPSTAAATPAAVVPATTPKPAAASSVALTLDLTGLEQRLRDTKAIGVFTKLSLKNQVDDLLGDFRALYKKAKPPPGPEFRQRYDLLLLKVLTLLQDGDPPLATAISSSKEAIWGILCDPDKLSKI
jgi:hypothetical protein